MVEVMVMGGWGKVEVGWWRCGVISGDESLPKHGPTSESKHLIPTHDLSPQQLWLGSYQRVVCISPTGIL